jgi:DNA primase small subunit
MELSDEARKAVVGWLEVIKGGKDMEKKVNVRLGGGKNGPGVLPPSIQTALEPLATIFSSLILTDQNCFGSEEGYETLLKLIPDRSVVDNLRKKWEADPDRHSADKWGDLKSEVKRFEKSSSTRVSILSSVIRLNLFNMFPVDCPDSGSGRHNSTIHLPTH